MKYNRNKKNYPRKGRAKQTTYPIGWLLGGILIGLIIPCFLWVKSQPHSHNSSVLHSEIKITEGDALTLPKLKHTHSQKLLVAKKSKPDYEFYNLLSSQEEGGEHHLEEPEETTDSSFTVEIATFHSYVDADQLKAKLLLKGIDDVSISKTHKNNEVIYNVVLGPFATKLAAEQAQKKLKEI